MTTKPFARAALAAALLCAATATAEAHAGGTLGGFQSGFLHPLTGLDHLLAMFAVGVWGAQIGGRSVWELPVTFPLIMAIGGVLGIIGVPLPHVEVWIGLSVLGLGLAIALVWRPLEWISVFCVGLFAIFHGHAHGAELPNAADPVTYAVGFVTATGMIHVAGIGFGLLLGQGVRGVPGRAAGALIALIGVGFLTHVISA